MCWLLVAGLLQAGSALGQPSFIAFESGPVRPLALSADGSRLFAANTPDNRLEIFDVGPDGIAHAGSVPVGMEPVAVAARTAGEVWVVNHLSDSVSIVDVAAAPPRVVRTLLVGDEPRDIVFAGPGGNRAFITTAHRGQHRTDPSIAAVSGAGDPRLTTPGVPRADVWVFDATALGEAPGGVPLRIVELFGDTPRALAASPDGGTVYVAVFNSGNRTTVASEGVVCDGFRPSTSCRVGGVEYPGGNPGPATDHAGASAPEVGLIVRVDPSTGNWEDELGRNWNNAVRFTLPDRDVFAIDAATLGEIRSYSGVGTTLFNLAVNPASGAVYVSNTEAVNEVRFEGPGAFGGSTVQGHLAEARVTVLDGGLVQPRHLNPHIDYGVRPAPPGTKEASLATPLDMAVSGDGATLYVAAFGSSKVGVLSTAALEAGTFDPVAAKDAYIAVSGGGPCGLALDEARGRLYVLTRFDNAVSVVDLARGREALHVPLHNPEPASLVEGRPFLYDAVATSSNGETSCASCHTFGDMDHLAWDLGNPDADVQDNPIPIKLEPFAEQFGPINGTGDANELHPMKGPMTTQTLRGLANHGAMHWRGDRAVGFFGTGAFDADLSFRNFIVAFEGLVGREEVIAESDMQKFSDFALQLTLPPNPNRPLDNSLTPAQAAGRAYFFGQDGPVSGPDGHRADGLPFLDDLGFTCNGCHTLDPAQGFFGTDGAASFESEPQIFKIAHLRNLYQKVGMFGLPNIPFVNPGDNQHLGDQVRGFGFLHDGSIDTLFRFLQALVFNPAADGLVGFNDGDRQRRDVEQFLLAFDSDLAPIVGQQVTLDASNAAAAGPRIDLLVARARAPFASKILGAGATECDLVAKAVIDGAPKGFVLRPSGLFAPDDGGPPLDDQALRALATAPGQAVTYTSVPPGSGERAGINRDADARLDGLDNCPAVPNDAQTDTDADGVGDLCDNRCGRGEPTRLAAAVVQRRVGATVDLAGSGFGPAAAVLFDDIASPAVTVLDETRLRAEVPAIEPGPATVRVVNPEGCRSLELLVVTVLSPLPGLPGDCDDDGAVTIDELITGVNIALGALAPSACAVVDADGDGDVRINDLIAAVGAALGGSPA